jgi:hypothetical protein
LAPDFLGPVISALGRYYGNGVSTSWFRDAYECFRLCPPNSTNSITDSEFGVTGLVGYGFDLANRIFVAPEAAAPVYVGGAIDPRAGSCAGRSDAGSARMDPV